MTTETVAQETAQKKKPSGKKVKSSGGNGACECSTPPSPVDFRLPKVKEGFMVGQYCGNCMNILNWRNEDKKDVQESNPSMSSTESGETVGIFPIIQVLPVKGSKDQMEFVCQNNGNIFSVRVQSTADKVAAAMTDNTKIVGKYAQIQYKALDQAGRPLEGKVLAVKPKEKFNQTK